MALVKDIIGVFEDFAPSSTADSWDNVGLLVGDQNNCVNKVLFSLDVTDEVIEEAIEYGANLIICHHPIIFSKQKSIVSGEFISDKVIKLIKNDISVFTAHTNLDKAVGGMNDTIMEVLGFKEFTSYLNEGLDYGKTVVLENMTLRSLIEKIKSSLEIDYLRYSGNLDESVKKLGVVNGSGDDFIDILENYGCDVILTGDMKYHDTLDAYQRGINIIDANHFGTEWKVFKTLVTKIIDNNKLKFSGIEYKFSLKSKEIFSIYK